MNTCRDTIAVVKKVADSNKSLTHSLKRWWQRDHRNLCTRKTYDKWLENLIDHLAGCLEEAIPENIFLALAVNGKGEVYGEIIDKLLSLTTFDHDMNAYVEENIVYSSIWIRGDTIKQTREVANLIAAIFRNKGYATDIYEDEENDCEITVNAQIDFPLYKELFTKVDYTKEVAQWYVAMTKF